MKLHYQGKYNLDPSSLPHGQHMPNAVKFNEPDDIQKLGIIASLFGLVVMVILAIPAFYRCGNILVSKGAFTACVASLFTLFPHELLHAICFKEDVYMYTHLKQGMMFVVGPETMSRTRFLFMSLCPNLVFGFIPYLIALLFPQLGACAVFGLFSLSCGGGDYYNVYNAYTQMPKNARTYMYGFHSYWYLPSETENSDWVKTLLSMKENKKVKV